MMMGFLIVVVNHKALKLYDVNKVHDNRDDKRTITIFLKNEMTDNHHERLLDVPI
jgi:hypothetical protein